MTAYRHAHAGETDTGCVANLERDGSWWYTPCDCTDPTPDPASPCGHPAAFGRCGGPAIWLAHRLDPEKVRTIDVHPHVPTLCTCGHPIEAVR